MPRSRKRVFSSLHACGQPEQRHHLKAALQSCTRLLHAVARLELPSHIADLRRLLWQYRAERLRARGESGQPVSAAAIWKQVAESQKTLRAA